MTDPVKYVAIIQFPEKAQTFEAMTKLSNEGAFVAAAVVERDEEGRLSLADAANAQIGAGVTSGGLIGMLVGVLGGPLGMLLGWSVGALGGAVSDASRADDQDAALSQFAGLVASGSNAIIAETEEASTAVLDEVISAAGGTIARRPYDEVIAEVEAQEEAAQAAAVAAKKALKEQKRAERRAEREAN